MLQRTILLIDNQVETLHKLEKLLNDNGYDPIIATTEDEVYSALEKYSLDLILLDLLLPDSNGIAICQRIKENPATEGIPLIFLSTSNQRSNFSEELKAGTEDYINKFSDNNEIIARINLHIELKNAKHTIQNLNENLKTINFEYEQEVAQATSFIQSILPPPLEKPCKIQSVFHPSPLLGGDTFNYFFIDNKLVVYLIDVSGQGLAGTIFSISITNIIRSQSLPGVNFLNPGDVLSELNKKFPMKQNGRKYFTCWYGVIDFENMNITYSSAGHPSPILMRDVSDSVEQYELNGEGIPVGFFPAAKYKNKFFSLQPEDEILIFSDGVFEISVNGGLTLGYERFNEVAFAERITRNYSMDSLMQSIYKINESEIFQDDFSLIRLIV